MTDARDDPDGADDTGDHRDAAGSEAAADADAGDHEGDEESQWRFTLKDLDRREAEAEAAAEAERRRNEPLVPGDPALENTLFVLLGALLALFVVSRLFLL